MEAIAAIAGVLIGIAIIGILIGAVFMHIGARLAQVEDATFVRSIIASVMSGIIVWFLSIICSIIPVVGTLLGFVFGIFCALLAIKSIYETSFGRAVAVWIFNIFAQIAAVIIGLMTFAGGLMAIF